MNTDERVVEHYTHGRLEDTILRAVGQAGKETESLTFHDLAAVDQFHVGGLEATQELANQMDLRPGLHLLDVGSGLGGPARYFAAEHGCQVTGIDLTDEFVQVATSLSRRVHLEHLLKFRQGSALNLPFEAETFDRAYMIHVGMNVADKAGVFREVRRVLKPGGSFAIFDIMRTADGPIRYPVPWAASEETSFVAGIASYREALEQAGFRVTKEHNLATVAIESTKRAMARMAQNGPAVLGLQLLMGDRTRGMISNIVSMMEEGVLAPVELFAEAL